MPPTSPDDDLPPADDLPLPKEDPSDTTTGVLEEEMPADDDAEKPYDDSEGDDAPVPPPAEEGDEPADTPEDTNTTSLDQPQWREWVDASGQHSTKAVLVAVDLAAGKISIRKENGKRIGVPLVKLSQADQDFVRSLAPSVASTAP